ncbi:hypothetical protein ABZP36_019683 [Zizania latifolia]
MSGLVVLLFRGLERSVPVKVATPRNKMYPHLQSNGTIFVDGKHRLVCLVFASTNVILRRDCQALILQHLYRGVLPIWRAVSRDLHSLYHAASPVPPFFDISMSRAQTVS